jgi:uncharacterized protein with HEPN domain
MAVAVEEAAELVGRGRDLYDEDRLMRRAAEAILTRFGEATRRVPEDFRQRHPEIPWPQIIGMRNRTTHEYARLDYDLVWETLDVSVPQLGELIAGFLDGHISGP